MPGPAGTAVGAGFGAPGSGFSAGRGVWTGAGPAGEVCGNHGGASSRPPNGPAPRARVTGAAGAAGRLELTGGTDVTTAPPDDGAATAAPGPPPGPPPCGVRPSASSGTEAPGADVTETCPVWNDVRTSGFAICSVDGSAERAKRVSYVSRRTRAFRRD